MSNRAAATGALSTSVGKGTRCRAFCMKPTTCSRNENNKSARDYSGPEIQQTPFSMRVQISPNTVRCIFSAANDDDRPFVHLRKAVSVQFAILLFILLLRTNHWTASHNKEDDGPPRRSRRHASRIDYSSEETPFVSSSNDMFISN